MRIELNSKNSADVYIENHETVEVTFRREEDHMDCECVVAVNTGKKVEVREFATNRLIRDLSAASEEDRQRIVAKAAISAIETLFPTIREEVLENCLLEYVRSRKDGG